MNQDSKILCDYDACFYADEPLVGEEWSMVCAISKRICRTQGTKQDATTKIRQP
jgi:hypothetical protein